jgi:hypothetical protein
MAFCDAGYTTNLPVADVTGGRAWVAFGLGDTQLEPSTAELGIELGHYGRPCHRSRPPR